MHVLTEVVGCAVALDHDGLYGLHAGAPAHGAQCVIEKLLFRRL